MVTGTSEEHDLNEKDEGRYLGKLVFLVMLAKMADDAVEYQTWDHVSYNCIRNLSTSCCLNLYFVMKNRFLRIYCFIFSC